MNRQVLVAVDNSLHNQEALQVIGGALKHQNNYDMLLFHCAQPHLARSLSEGLRDGHSDWSELRREQTEAAEILLEEAKATLKSSGFPEHRIKCEYVSDCSDPAREILRKAESLNIHTIVVGRRGLSPMKKLLLGSVSDKIAQYSPHRSVWVIDSPIADSNNILLAFDRRPESKSIAVYATRFLNKLPDADFTLLHLISPLPPLFWDDGHILCGEELKERIPQIAEWESHAREQVKEHLDQCHDILVSAGIAPGRIRTLVQPVREGISRDILKFAHDNQVGVLLIGKKSLAKRKPFFLGSHAHKILHYSKGVALCLVDANEP